MKKIFLILSLIGIAYFCEKKTEGFTILAISSDRPYNPTWKTRDLSLQELSFIKNALSQKFRYFGCGGQLFVFFSEDQKYVLKLFKQKSYAPSWWIDCIPHFFSYKHKKIEAKRGRFLRDFESYKLAFEKIPKETGTLYSHLNRTDDLKTALVLIDKFGIEHSLKADDFEFVLQERAEMVSSRLGALMHEGDIEGAKKALSSLLELIASRSKRGVVDRYPNLFKNFGFIADRAVELDVGRFTHGHTQEGLPRLRLEFGRWLEIYYPELVSHWEEEFDCFQRSILRERCST